MLKRQQPSLLRVMARTVLSPSQLVVVAVQVVLAAVALKVVSTLPRCLSAALALKVPYQMW